MEIAFKDWLCIPLPVFPISGIVIGRFSKFNSPILLLFLSNRVVFGRFMFLFVDSDLSVEIIWVLSCERILSFQWHFLIFGIFNWPIRSIHSFRSILSFRRFDFSIQCVHYVKCLSDCWDIVGTMRCHQILVIFPGFITLSDYFLHLFSTSFVDLFLFFFTEFSLILRINLLFSFLFDHLLFLLSSLFSLFSCQGSFLILI